MNMLCAYGKWPLFHVFALTFILRVNSTFIERPVDTTVTMGNSTYLNCSISSSAPAEVSWYHYPVGEGTSNKRVVYSGGKILKPYAGRFEIEKGALKGTFDLVIKRAKLRDAGFYVCQIRGTTKRTIVHLTVLESGPLWMTDIDPIGFIGRNSCGLKSDTIRLSCDIRYKGNVTPKLQMTLVQNDQRIAVKESNFWCVSSDVSVNCKYSTEAEKAMDGSFFICYTNTSESTHLENRTDIIKILSFSTEMCMKAGYAAKSPVDGNTEDKRRPKYSNFGAWNFDADYAETCPVDGNTKDTTSWSFSECLILVMSCMNLVAFCSLFCCDMSRCFEYCRHLRGRRLSNDLEELWELWEQESSIHPLDIRKIPKTAKLQAYGIGGRILFWIKNWLLNRRQKVGIRVLSSEPQELMDENYRLREALKCKVCFDKEADTVFLSCCHLICCSTCSPEVNSCPYCRMSFAMHTVRRRNSGDHQGLDSYSHPLITPFRFATEPLEENARLREGLNCMKCMDKEADAVFLPCYHLVCCRICAPAVYSCPLCQRSIRERFRVYMP